MKVMLDEQDLVDAVCVYEAGQRRIRIGEVKAELIYEPGSGIGAETIVGDETTRLSEQDVIDSVAVLLADSYRFVPDRLRIELGYEEERGIFAEAVVVS